MILTSIFSICPLNKHGTIESYASIDVNLATPSNISINKEDDVSKATPSNASKNDGVHIKEDADTINIDDISDVSLIDMADAVGQTVNDNIAVRVPAFIQMEGHSTETKFIVEIIGTMDENSILDLTTDTEFKLSAIMKKDINAKITLDKTEVTSADFIDNKATVEGTITLDRALSAGKWSGDFSISLSLDSPSLQDIEWEYMNQVDDLMLDVPVEDLPAVVDDTVVDEPTPLPDETSTPVEESSPIENEPTTLSDEPSTPVEDTEITNLPDSLPVEETETSSETNTETSSETSSIESETESSELESETEMDTSESESEHDIEIPEQPDVEIDTGSNDEELEEDSESDVNETEETESNESSTEEESSDTEENVEQDNN